MQLNPYKNCILFIKKEGKNVFSIVLENFYISLYFLWNL
jgi:hypothetical protein